MKYSVVIVAGGKGLRMGSEVPKQFLPLNGKPIILHTIDCFLKALPGIEIVLVLPKSELPRWQVMSYDTPYQDLKIAEGGAQRFDSVKSGLKLVSGKIVGVHDAVRPLVKASTIKKAFETAEKSGGAIPVMPMKDSLRKLEDGQSTAVDRSKYCLVQTPQCFQTALLKKAYSVEYAADFTDDASVFEAAGNQLELIEGNAENIKITEPEDLHFAALYLQTAK